VKFPRNARILKGRQDAAPYASVFFLLVLFVMMGSLVYTPGVLVPLDLPAAEELPGTEQPTLAVAIDANGQLYFENELIGESDLKSRLSKAAANSREPLTLIVQADKAVRYDRLIQLTLVARRAGIHEALLATLPSPLAAPAAAAPRSPAR
jgi:biopolymer transport protein ExbD